MILLTLKISSSIHPKLSSSVEAACALDEDRASLIMRGEFC
ncbi:MAG: hypothetical protein V6006_00490 [Candidatus Dasytiphilus stammeri]